MNEALLLNLYNKYNLSQKGDFNTFKADMANPNVRQSFFNKYGLAKKGDYSIFESDLLGTVNQPVQQQPVVTKPVLKQEEQGFIGRSIDKVKNFFTNEEETPQEKISNKLPPSVNPNLKKQNVTQSTGLSGFDLTKDQMLAPVKTDAQVSKDAQIGYKPGTSFEEQKSILKNNYDKNIKNIIDKYAGIAIMGGKFDENGRPDLKKLHPETQANLEKELKPFKLKYKAELNKLEAQPLTNRKGLITDADKNKIIPDLENFVNQTNNEINSLSKKNEFLNLAKEANPLEKGITAPYNMFQAYLSRKVEIDKKKQNIKDAKQDLKDLNKYNTDDIKALQTIPKDELIQFVASKSQSVRNLLNSAKKSMNLADETSIVDLNKDQNFLNNLGEGLKKGLIKFTIGGPQALIGGAVDLYKKDFIKVNNYQSDSDIKNAWEQTTNYFYNKVDIRNKIYKDKLQQKIVKNGWDKDINALDEKFNSLLEDFPILKNDSNQLISRVREVYDTPEEQQKFLSLVQDSDFQEIVKNNEALYNLNGARVGESLKMFQKQKTDELQALKVVKNLNERQQLAQDMLELQSKKSGLFSTDRVKYYLQQVNKATDYAKEYGKQGVGSLATTINPDSENARKVQYSADLWKAINFAQDEGNLSIFNKGVKWVNVKADKNNNYQISFNNLGQVVDVRASDMSIPVKGSQRDLIENYFYSNSNELKKQAGDIYSMPGGTSAALGGTSKAVGVGILEEVPTIALEAGATIMTEGFAAPLLEASLTKLGAKLLTAQNVRKNFSKVSGQVINYTSSYAEIKHDVEKNYRERGLDPGLQEIILSSGAQAGVAQLAPGLENKYRKLGADLVADKVKKEASNVFIEDIPKVIKSLTDDLIDIKNPRLKDYLLKKELRNYALARFSDRMTTVAKSFRKEGFQEAGEEVILEPLAQVLANAANASLTGNEDYTKETLKEMGFLDPETALIAGLTGGIMSSGIEASKVVSDLTETLTSDFKTSNGTHTIDALQAAIKDPNKFKSLLSTFIDNPSPSGNSLTQDTYNNFIQSFDTIKNNFEQTKQQFNLDNDFISKLDFENPLHKSILESVGVNMKNIEGFNGSKTFDNIILNSELNKIDKSKAVTNLAESLGIPNNNNQLDLSPYLDNNGFFSYDKYNEIIGKDTLDEVTLNNIKEYNTIVGKEKNTQNLINLFNTALGPIQEQFKNTLQETLSNNPELLNPQAGFIKNIYQENLFNKLTNQVRIDKINSLLEIGQGKTKDKELQEELKALNEANNDLDKTLNSITNTYTNGYFDAQENLRNLDQEFENINAELQDKLNTYLSPSTVDSLSEEKENEITNLLKAKSDKLKEIKKTTKEFNSRFNNGLKSQTLNKKALVTDEEGNRTVKDVTIDKQLEESIKGDKERLNKIKEYRKIFSKLENGKVTKQELAKLKDNNRLYNKQLLLETVLPYYVSFNKDELIEAFDMDPDLLLGMFSILEDMGYVGDIQNYKNINLDTLTSIVTDGIIKLNYNISLLNSNQENDIKNIDQKNGALLINNYIKIIKENSKKNQEESTIETPIQPSNNIQDNVISLIEKNSKPRSEFNENEITNNAYIINGKEYKRVTTVERDELNSNQFLTAGGNVGNFFDSLGRFVFGNLDITKEDMDSVLKAQLDYFQSKGISINLKPESYIRMFNTLIEQRNVLIKQGFKFITEERVIYHAYDGLKFTGEGSPGIDDNTIGVAGTMDIIAIGKNGKVDIIDLKTISDNKGKATANLRDKETNGWAQQLGFYKTLLEKIPSVKVNNTKVFISKVKYDISELGNKISFLNFTETTFKSLNISKPILALINNYLSVPNLVIDKPAEIITDTQTVTEEEMPDYILEQQMLLVKDNNSEVPSFEDFGPDEFALMQGTAVIEPETLEETPTDAELAALEQPTLSEVTTEPTEEENARAQSVFGTKSVLNPETQLITGQANATNFETSSNNNLQGFEDEADSNIFSLQKVVYVKYNITYDEENNKQYVISIFNNQKLNQKFNNKILTESEVEKLFKDNGLFFSNKDIESDKVYVLKDINKNPINSFQKENIISKQSIPESTILNSVYANDLVNQEGEIVVLDTEDGYNNTLKTEQDFRNNVILGVVVNNALVSIIPSNKNNAKNAKVRNNLTINKVGNNFTVQPFKVKIKKVKKDAFLFNNKPVRINSFLNQIDGFKSTIAFVAEKDKVKKLIDPFAKRDVSELAIPAGGLTNNGVYLILERSGETPTIIPLETPSLKEFFGATDEDLQNINSVLSQNISDVFESRDLKANYNNFVERLKNAADTNPLIAQISKVIPTSINETSTNTSQKIKLENLKLNFNLANVTDYLWDTLITLNENTKDFYSVDLDPANLYANNYVIIDYDKNIITNTTNNNTTSDSVFNQDNDVHC